MRGVRGRLRPAGCAGAWRGGWRSWRSCARRSCSWRYIAAPGRSCASRSIRRQPATRASSRTICAGARTHTPARRRAAAATRYMRAQPFSASSTLLFASCRARGTSTNRPELFAARAPDNGETAAEQAPRTGWRPSCCAAPDGYSTLRLPDVGELRLLKRRCGCPGGLSVTVGVGEPLAAVGARAGEASRARSSSPGCSALARALLASYLIGARVSRPLRRMAAVAAQVDAGDLHPRIHDPGGHGRRGEGARGRLQPHARPPDRGVRRPARVRRRRLARAAHAADGDSRAARSARRRSPTRSAAEVRRVERLVQAEIARISRLVDDLLLLAKTEQTEFLRVEPIDLPPTSAELWDGTSLLADRRFELGDVPAGTLRADPDRLAQALRNLLGNAIEHTRRAAGWCACASQALAGRTRPLRRRGRRAGDPRPTSASAFSIASIAPMPRATARRAAPASVLRSCARSPMPTAASSARAARPRAAREWSSSCRGSRQAEQASRRGLWLTQTAEPRSSARSRTREARPGCAERGEPPGSGESGF